MSILSDDFLIDSHLGKSTSSGIDKNLIMNTESHTEEEIDSMWMEYCQLPKSERIRQDSDCFELYGVSSQTLYEQLKADARGESIVTEAASEEEVLPSYTATDLCEAIEWSKVNTIPLIYPTESLEKLEELFSDWNSYPKSIRHDSDIASIRFFGINNINHYKYLKSRFLQAGAINESKFIYQGELLKLHEALACNQSIALPNRIKDLLSMAVKKNEAYDDAIINAAIDKAVDAHILSTQNIHYDTIPFEDLPFYTPEELIDFGVCQDNPEMNYYGCEPATDVISEEEMKQWLKEYTNLFNGFSEGYDACKWKNTIQRLILKRSVAGNATPYNQALLNLGWCPEAEFSPENQVKASKRIKMIARESQGSAQIVDISDFSVDEDAIISEADTATSTLKPVFIVLQSGKSLFSQGIKMVTKSDFSHAAISFDPKLEEMISYGIEGSEKGVIGGLIKENIKNKPNIKFGVFTFFLKEDDWNKLKQNVDTMVKNTGKTIYSYLNLLVSHIFKIPMEFDTAMVCSQFVDKMLKLTDIDITNMNSSLVAPSTFEKVAKQNKKIYKVFEGSCKHYSPKTILRKIQTLLKKAKPIKESISWTDSNGIVFEMIDHVDSLTALQELNSKIDLSLISPRVRRIYETMLLPCLEAGCYTEAKNAPIQMDKYGNVFINNIRKRNYESDYQMSHKLLRQYEKSGNIEGMKYELARLWAMNLYVKDKLESKKFQDMDLDERNKTPEMKVYPKLVNDIQYFLGIVMKAEPNFNFSKYYEKTQFNADNIKIGNSTILWSIKYLKAMLSGI